MRPVWVALIFSMAMTGCSFGNGTTERIDPYQVLPGKWGWEGSSDCSAEPLEIRFSQGGKRMHISHAPEGEDGKRLKRHDTDYTILGPTGMGLSMAMEGEDRLDDSGKPVTWDLVLLDDDQYCWHRNDWPATACTKPVNRCAG